MINLDKLRALVTLATDHGAAEGEARNAAAAACRLICDGHFDFGVASSGDSLAVLLLEANARNLVLMEQLLNLRDQLMAAQSRPQRDVTPPSTAKLMRAKFASHCRYCGDAIDAGDFIYYSKQCRSAWHEHCDVRRRAA